MIYCIFIFVSLGAAHANRFLKRTFFHPGTTKCEEQKREAREDYEERCEPSFPLFRNTGTRRFCPDINDWKDFDNYEIGNGYEGGDTRTGDQTNRNQYPDQNQYPDRNKYNTNNRNNDRRNRPTTAIPDFDIEDIN